MAPGLLSEWTGTGQDLLNPSTRQTRRPAVVASAARAPPTTIVEGLLPRINPGSSCPQPTAQPRLVREPTKPVRSGPGRAADRQIRTTMVSDRLLLVDVGNTHTHVGWATRDRILRRIELPTGAWEADEAEMRLSRWVGKARPQGAVLASVVPRVTSRVRAAVWRHWKLRPLELNARTLRGLPIDYPRPETIGADRLANAVAARHWFGAPVVVVDFGTAVTFDVVDPRGCYIGGIIAPGLAAMTEYLHERTALLPRIRLRPCDRVVGRSTEEAMLAGTFYGYPGLVEALLRQIRKELGVRRLKVIATGGYAALMAERIPQIQQVCPDLTLEGLRLTWCAHHGPSP